MMASSDLHGNAPDRCDVALLLIDVINDLEFVGGEELLPHALEMAHHIARLKERARDHGVPVVYANDNFGKWQSDFYRLLKHCLEDGARGESVVRLVRPTADDYFVLKPKHSAFFSTTLDTLLRYLGTRTLIITGMATDICVLFTANDAYMRDFKLLVPSDCVAAEHSKINQDALSLMRRVLKADTVTSDQIDFENLLNEESKSEAV